VKRSATSDAAISRTVMNNHNLIVAGYDEILTSVRLLRSPSAGGSLAMTAEIKPFGEFKLSGFFVAFLLR
jgi:hypothetical protein